MNTRRRFLAASAFLALGATIPLARAKGPSYDLLPNPQPKEVPGKIEVLEFFSYGCGHCYELNPLLKRWAANLPDSVSFRRVPVTWNPAFANLARLYYTLEATGDLARLDDAVFEALHVQRQNIYSTQGMRDWYVKQGGEIKKFTDTFNSFNVQNRILAATRLMEKMKIDSVPLLVVEGRFRVLGDTFPEQLANLDALIAELRQPASK